MKLNTIILSVLFLLLCSSCGSDKSTTKKGKKVSKKTSKKSIVKPVSKVDKEKEDFWIFVMAGQSNMAGRAKISPQDTVLNDNILVLNNKNEWVKAKAPLSYYEPEVAGLSCGISFANKLYALEKNKNLKIGLVPSAYSGSTIKNWLGGKTDKGVMVLQETAEKVKVAQEKGVVKAILWHQGEANAKSGKINKYEQHLKMALNKLRRISNNNNLPILVGELGDFAKAKEKKDWSAINGHINNVAATDKNIHLVTSKGLKHKGDNLHFNAESIRKMGKRYAEVYNKNYSKSAK